MRKKKSFKPAFEILIKEGDSSSMSREAFKKLWDIDRNHPLIYKFIHIPDQVFVETTVGEQAKNLSKKKAMQMANQKFYLDAIQTIKDYGFQVSIKRAK